jgi:hypothetical protein
MDISCNVKRSSRGYVQYKQDYRPQRRDKVCLTIDFHTPGSFFFFESIYIPVLQSIEPVRS